MFFRFILILIILFLAVFLLQNYLLPSRVEAPAAVQRQSVSITPTDPEIPAPAEKTGNTSPAPLEKAAERITKKPFGIFINPQNSPVQPEKFRGYHTGTDFEIFPEELDSDIPVRAVCAGKLVSKRSASGYGGVAVESCEIDSQPVTIIYGHLELASISKKIGDGLATGETIGILGKNKSSETDGERKHLHLGISKGRNINLSGYVRTEKELENWIDPCSYFCN